MSGKSKKKRTGNVDHGQFRPGLRPEELLPLIRQVSLAAAEDPDDFAEVTMTTFDAKAQELGIAIPKAKSLTQRFHTGWNELLLIAHADPVIAARRLGLATSDRSRKGLTVAECAYALRRVARSLDVETLKREQYAEERAAMVQRAGRSAEAQTAAELVLPTLNQINEVLEQHQAREGLDAFGWDDLLDLAGLERRDPSESRGGLTPEQAVEMFASEFGRAPSGTKVLIRWAAARQLRCAQIPTPLVQATVRALNGRRVAEGLEPLEPMAPKDVDWAQVAPVAEPTRWRMRPRGSWVKRNCVAGMALAMQGLPSTARLTQAALKAAAKKDPDVPGYTQVHTALRDHNAEHGSEETFDLWRQEAARLGRTKTETELRELAAPVLPEKQQLNAMNAGFASLREDEQAAADFDAETAQWDSTSGDGLRAEAQEL